MQSLFPVSSLTAHHYSIRASLHTKQCACSLTSTVERVTQSWLFWALWRGREGGRKREGRHYHKYICYLNIRNIRNIRKPYLIAEETTFTVLLEHSTMAEDTVQHTSSAAVMKRLYHRRGPNQEKFWISEPLSVCQTQHLLTKHIWLGILDKNIIKNKLTL